MRHSPVRVLDPRTLEVIEEIPIPKSLSEVNRMEISKEAKEFLIKRFKTLKKSKHHHGDDMPNWDAIRKKEKDQEQLITENAGPSRLQIWDIQKKIAKHKSPEKEILEAALLYNLTSQEIADSVGKTRGAVDLIVYRFRQQELRML